ncbi:MAG: hypothetical protein LUB59_04135 [Candidatus Gastranaerophilales bacterium]|nr:hypothetical protein [Candidatus Gastranaerophilales bacterium]
MIKKVLIVDDSTSWTVFHENNVDEVFLELGIDDYEVNMASTARDGYDFVMENNNVPYDLIISDLQMEEDFSPKYAGEWFVEQVRTLKNYDNTRILICSGCYNIKQIAESLAVNYIPKRKAITDISSYKSEIISLLKQSVNN